MSTTLAYGRCHWCQQDIQIVDDKFIEHPNTIAATMPDGLCPGSNMQLAYVDAESEDVETPPDPNAPAFDVDALMAKLQAHGAKLIDNMADDLADAIADAVEKKFGIKIR